MNLKRPTKDYLIKRGTYLYFFSVPVQLQTDILVKASPGLEQFEPLNKFILPMPNIRSKYYSPNEFDLEIYLDWFWNAINNDIDNEKN